MTTPSSAATELAEAQAMVGGLRAALWLARKVFIIARDESVERFTPNETGDILKDIDAALSASSSIAESARLRANVVEAGREVIATYDHGHWSREDLMEPLRAALDALAAHEKGE